MRRFYQILDGSNPEMGYSTTETLKSLNWDNPSNRFTGVGNHTTLFEGYSEIHGEINNILACGVKLIQVKEVYILSQQS